MLSAQSIIEKTISESILPIQFHAFYWGKFDLVDSYEKDGYSYFAKANSLALNRFLSFQEDRIYLHIDNDIPLLISSSLQELLHTPSVTGQHLVYDTRPAYEDLFTPQQMYVSDFRDPEDFEEVAAYLSLIKGIDKHFGGLLGLKDIDGSEDNEVKHINLHLKERVWKIQALKELFDLDVLNDLNKLLVDLGNDKEALHLSINRKMYMVILKLDERALADARRMGMVV